MAESIPVPPIEVLALSETTTQSVAKVALRGLNRPCVNYLSDMTYTVLCGQGTIEHDFSVTELRPGITVNIPAGTPYQDEGDVVMLVTARPAFTISSVEFLDEERYHS